MNIPFIDLKKQFKNMEPEMRAAIDEVLAHGQFIMGPEINRLESELASMAGVNHVVACGSGTDALIMALMAHGVGPGDAVFTSPFTFIATAEVISLLGATPVFVDIDPITYNIDPNLLEREIDNTMQAGELKPKCIIPVDLFGLPADYDPIMSIAEAKGLFVLEDAAQSFGGVYHGRPACGLGHAAATSFFPAKPLGCYGDGGAVFTDDGELDDRMRSIRVHGQGSNKYDNIRIGLNARMDTLQAAILLVKLKSFPAELEARQKVAARYTEGLKDLVETPVITEGLVSAWAQYSILSEKREFIQASLKEAGVPTAIYYPKPLHLQEAFSDLGLGPGTFPISESISEKVFSLPMHPYLEDETIDFIVGRIAESIKQGD